MKKQIYILTMALCLPLLLFGQGEEVLLNRTQIQQNFCDLLSSIQAEFEAYYAPRFWKEEQNGWTLDSAIEEAKARILAETSTDRQDYQAIIRDFFASTQDYHVGVGFLNWDVSFLGFDVVSTRGRTFITHVYRDILSKSAFPFETGDEIVLFDGEPVSQVLEEIADQINGSNPASNLGLADKYLTFRSAARGVECPQGPLTLTVRPKDAEKDKTVQIVWSYNDCPCCRDPEIREATLMSELQNIPIRHMPDDPRELKRGFEKFFKPSMELPHNEIFKRQARAMGDRHANHFALGSRDSILPQLGPVWWKAKPIHSWWGGAYLPFQAYIYETKNHKHRVGFVRIPSYSGDDEKAEYFRQIIEIMEKDADMLIIDQMYNPGGSVIYSYALASMLTDTALQTPQHQLAVSEGDWAFAKYIKMILQAFVQNDDDARAVLGETFGGYPVSYQLVQMWIHQCDFVMEQWEKGNILTEPTYLMGVDQINPHPTTRFTKPILFLTNALDFSGGDFFPSILQDNDRVTIMGGRTAGAGGAVLGDTAGDMNNTGLWSFRFTWTLAWRPSGAPIEDLGVIPDFPYELSVRDIQEDCADFVDRIHWMVDHILSTNES